MNKRSAIALAAGIVVALMATMFAVSVTARPGASASERAEAATPGVRTVTKTVTVRVPGDVSVPVSSASSPSASRSGGSDDDRSGSGHGDDRHGGDDDGYHDDDDRSGNGHDDRDDDHSGHGGGGSDD